MEESTHLLIPTETLLASDMFGEFVALYIFTLVVLFVSFLNIYSVDKYEFLNNKQDCFEFKFNMFFILMHSKVKHIVSKKTFILEIIGYLLLIVSVISFICSINQEITTAFIYLGIVALLIFIFGCVTGFFYNRMSKM